MPGLIVGALLASLTYLVGRRVLPGSRGAIEGSSRGSRWISLGAALRIVASATLSYQSGSADGSAPFALLAAPLAWYLLPLPLRQRLQLPGNPAAEIGWQYWPRERTVEREQRRTMGPSVLSVLDLAVMARRQALGKGCMVRGSSICWLINSSLPGSPPIMLSPRRKKPFGRSSKPGTSPRAHSSTQRGDTWPSTPFPTSRNDSQISAPAHTHQGA
jgi:hypothetical protein